MRNTKNNLFKVSGFIISLVAFIGCGSFQNSSYYSDGIYGSRDVVVIRQKAEQPAAVNSYSQYFDEKAKEYQWDIIEGDVALTQIDSINAQNTIDNQSKPQWGDGNNSTQIVFVDNRPNFGFGGFGGFGFGFGNTFGYGNAFNFGGFYDPYLGNWNWPYRYNNPYFPNRFGGGFYSPYFAPYGPYFGGFGYFNQPFYGSRSFYRNPHSRIYYQNNRYANNNNRARRRAYSSTYRGQAGNRSTRATRVNTASVQGTQAINGRNSRAIVQRDANQSNAEQTIPTVPNLVQEGRRATQARRSTQQRNTRNNSAYIDRVIRSYQTQGYDVDVIRDPGQARRRITTTNNQRYSNGTVQNRPTTTASTKSDPSPRRNNNSSSSYTKPKSNSSASSRSSYSRSSSSSSRSSSSMRSSSGRSSGRSSSGRRQ